MDRMRQVICVLAVRYYLINAELLEVCTELISIIAYVLGHIESSQSNASSVDSILVFYNEPIEGF